MTRCRLRSVAVVGCLLLTAIGCETRTGEERQWGPVSTPPWTIGGVRPGMTGSEVERMLGSPARSTTSYGRTTNTWNNPEVSVTFDGDGKAIDMLGDRLNTPSGELVISRGVSEDEVVGRLGAGRSKGSYRPSGSGVISCGMTRVGAEHVYEDATVRYSISIYEGRLASVRAQPLSASGR